MALRENDPLEGPSKAAVQQGRTLYTLPEPEMLEALVDTMAHEFDTVLSAVLSYTELTLSRLAAGERAWHNMQAVVTAALQAQHLVQHLREVGRQAPSDQAAPCLPQSDALPASGDTGHTDTRGHGRILYVDDDIPLARLAQAMLERLGYEVVTYTCSTTALAAFRAAPQAFDVVMTDQHMPGMTGEALIRALRAVRDTMPVILCTGLSEMLTPHVARALGISAICPKPFRLRDLSLALQQALAPAGV